MSCVFFGFGLLMVAPNNIGTVICNLVAFVCVAMRYGRYWVETTSKAEQDFLL